jgi:hypothetical protein
MSGHLLPGPGMSPRGLAPPRWAATQVVRAGDAGFGEPARDLDQFDVGVLGGTDEHPEGLFAGDAEPLHEDALGLPDEVAAFQRLVEVSGVVDAVEQQCGLQPEQAGRGARGFVERVGRARVEVERGAGAAVGGQVGGQQRLVAVRNRLRGEARPAVRVRRLTQVVGQDDTVVGRGVDCGDAGSFVKLRLEIVELADVVVVGLREVMWPFSVMEIPPASTPGTVSTATSMIWVRTCSRSLILRWLIEPVAQLGVAFMMIMVGV